MRLKAQSSAAGRLSSQLSALAPTAVASSKAVEKTSLVIERASAAILPIILELAEGLLAGDPHRGNRLAFFHLQDSKTCDEEFALQLCCGAGLSPPYIGSATRTCTGRGPAAAEPRAADRSRTPWAAGRAAISSSAPT